MSPVKPLETLPWDKGCQGVKSRWRVGSQFRRESLGEVDSLGLCVRSGWGCGGPRLLHNRCCSSTDPGRQTPWKQKRRCFWSPGPRGGGPRDTQQKHPEEPSKGRGFRCPGWTTLWPNDSFFFFFTEIQKYVSNHFQRHCFGEGGIKTLGGVIRVLYGVVNS